MLMALQVQFAQTALGLGRRYRRLNLAIQSAFPKGMTYGILTPNVMRSHSLYCRGCFYVIMFIVMREEKT